MKISSRFPSVQTIASVLNLDAATASKVREAMEQVEMYIPRNVRNALDTIDSLLGTHGVESMENMAYCNAGDPYRPTVLFIDNPKNYGPPSGFAVGNWGYFVETYPTIFK